MNTIKAVKKQGLTSVSYKKILTEMQNAKTSQKTDILSKMLTQNRKFLEKFSKNINVYI